MNSNKIEKLQKKFMLVAGLSFFIFMLLMGGLMYLSSLLTTQREVRMVMNYLIENDGDLGTGMRKSGETLQEELEDEASQDKEQTDEDKEETSEIDDSKKDPSVTEDSWHKYFGVGSWMYNSAEFPYSTRYFAVIFSDSDEVKAVKTNHIAGVEPEEAEKYARAAMERRLKFGIYDGYYYQVAEREEGGTIVVYLESLRQIDSVNRLLYTALTLIGIGSIVTLFLVRFFSKQIVKKEMESMELQNRFMTNASHELKTPLAVIKANTEVEQMLNGENEWNQSTMRQVERMTGLIQNLIRIVRAEEQENTEPVQRIDASAIITDTVKTFEPLASQEGKQLDQEIDASVSCFMRESDLRQLLSLFLDNAIKYCDEKGRIFVSLKAKGKNMKLSVSNSYAEGEKTDYSRFFERFYRKDESHNIEKGGYGIGLSIAESIVKQYHGSIMANWKDGEIFFHCQFHNGKKTGGEGGFAGERRSK